jgi:hypothetical protein
MTKEALKLALEALEFSKPAWASGGFLDERKAKHTEAIAAIKQALAAPPTHKTARWTDEEYREISDQVISTLVEYGAELRTADCQMQILREELAESRREVAQLKAQRQWVGLSQDELDAMFSNTIKGKKLVNWVARAIEAKLKELNT